MKTQYYYITLFLFLCFVTGVAAADEENTTLVIFPQEFWGGVSIGGSAAPVGTTITAVIDGNEYGSVTTTTAGSYGGATRHEGKHLIVSGTNDQIGKTITFQVNGKKAKETAVFTPKKASRLDLSVAGSGSSGGNSRGGGGGGGSSPHASVTSVPTKAQSVQFSKATLPVSEFGKVLSPLTVKTTDNVGSVTIPKDTTALDSEGQPLGEVTIKQAELSDISGFITPGNTVGFALSCGPEGATFDPSIILTYTLSDEEWAQIGDFLKVVWYNEESRTWQEVPATIDPETHTITAEVSHFSLFALTWASPPPVVKTSGPTGTVTSGAAPTEAGSVQAQNGDMAGIFVGSVVIVLLILIGGLFVYKKKKQ